MLTNVCIIAYTTPNYYISKYFEESVERIMNKEDIYLKKEKLPSDYFGEKDGLRSKIWYHCLRRKLEHLKDTLIKIKDKYDYYIFSDCDIQYFRNEKSWTNLFTFIRYSSKNIFFLRENTWSDVNTGFYIIKNNYIDHFVKYLEQNVLSKDIRQYPLGDQDLINRSKHYLCYEYIPLEFTIWATNYKESNKDTYILHHAVVTSNCKEKEKQMLMIQNLMRKP